MWNHFITPLREQTARVCIPDWRSEQTLVDKHSGSHGRFSCSWFGVFLHTHDFELYIVEKDHNIQRQPHILNSRLAYIYHVWISLVDSDVMKASSSCGWKIGIGLELPEVP